ncbi:MAG: hypothetical protein GY835_23440 [bacterium]|nr:hypothetical protein [bacterium]
MLLKPGLLPDLGFEPEDFCILRHRAVWLAMTGLHASGHPIDLRAVQARVETTRGPRGSGRPLFRPQPLVGYTSTRWTR